MYGVHVREKESITCSCVIPNNLSLGKILL